MKNHLFLIAASLIGLTSFCQTNLKSVTSDQATIPKESIYVHLNSTLLFSGESLQYKIFCMNSSSKKLSQVSKIGYIALVGRGDEIVFINKQRLLNGEGNGDFFIPASVPTGSYKLLGYSEWMKNWPVDNFFQTDVYIINPYKPIPKPYLNDLADSSDVTLVNKIHDNLNIRKFEKNSTYLDLSISDTVLGKRRRVNLTLSALNKSTMKGAYSLSVRKQMDMKAPRPKSPSAFRKSLEGDSKQLLKNKTIIPEMRGEIISGKIVDKNELPTPNKKVALSLPGEHYILKTSLTNNEGEFFFILERTYENNTAAIQLLEKDWNDYTIQIDVHSTNFGELNFSDFKLGPELTASILEKSIQIQIQNAYLKVRADSVLKPLHGKHFYHTLETIYNLDDYTRLNSIPETFIEIIDQVSIRNDNGGRVFQVRPPEGFTNSRLLPMVFVDGLFLRNFNNLMDFSAKKIKSIAYSRDKYILGVEVFQGIISFETFTGDFAETYFSPEIQKIDLFKPQPEKVYFLQRYSEDKNQTLKRVPDFRHQLVWMPNLDLESNLSIEFYTSDLEGDYEIVLEGFTETGFPVEVRKWIRVE